MKILKSILACAMALVLSTPLWQSCEKISLDESENSGENTKAIQLTFHLLTPSNSRATSVADFKSVWVVDRIGEKVMQVIRQDVGTSSDFGSPTLQLTSGNHTLHFFATDVLGATLSETTVSQHPLGDSFHKTITIDTKKISGQQRVVLLRQVAKVINAGNGTHTLNGVLSYYDMTKGPIENNPEEVTIATGQSLYTYVPSCGYLTLADGTHIPVSKNHVTRINTDGSSEGGGGGDPVEPELDEELVLETDTALIYVSAIEIPDVQLNTTPDPISAFAGEMGIYRIPTRREALVLNAVTLPDYYWMGQRCLCYDTPADAGKTHGSTKLGTGNYYTFMWGSGSVTTAGTKTKYSIKPIRSVPLISISQPFGIDADFTWDTNITEVK